LLRGIRAVLFGFVAVFVLSLGTDQVLHMLKVYPPWGESMSDGLFVLATAYRIVYGAAGSYIAARLAPDRPMMHALVLGSIGFVLSIAGAAATWNHLPPLGPHWYPIALVLTALPCGWLGGKLWNMQIAQVQY
jgi:hypothetical protein